MGSESRAADQAKVLHRNLWILAILSVALVAALAIAPAQSSFTEWRGHQVAYNRQARTLGQDPLDLGLKQVWREEIRLADRCVTCHLGMGGEKALASADPRFTPHPEVHHDVATMGCTICHRGQGRATEADAAHGHVEHWDDPLLPTAFQQASCGPCHGEAVTVAARPAAAHGEYLFDLHGCLACHLVDGDGGKVGPDLSGIALKDYDRSWHIEHLRDPPALSVGSRMMRFGHLDDDEIDALLQYMETLVGAPRLMRGKALSVEFGCRGCHVIDGVGGDVGADPAEMAGKPAHERDFSRVEGDHTLENWHRQHLRAPAVVSPGSVMPAFDLEPEDEDALLTYMLSLRDLDLPMELLPAQTIQVRIGGERDFPVAGEAMYGLLCSACHGPDGEGQLVEAMHTTVPGVFGHDMLTVASRPYLAETLQNGRSGRDMPAWGPTSGLREDELQILIDHLRDQLPQAPTLDEVDVAMGSADPVAGETVFRYSCSGCHGLDAEGTDIAPGLVSPEFRFVADRWHVAESVLDGRPGTAMPAHPELDAHTVASLVTYIDSVELERVPTTTASYRNVRMGDEIGLALGTRDLAGYRAAGSAAYGEMLFDATCSGCHGQGGMGGTAPAIGGEGFLGHASDGFIAGTLVLGRSQRPMKPFGQDGIARLEEREIGDIIAYLRDSAAIPGDGNPGGQVQGDAAQGAGQFEVLCAGCHGPSGGGDTAPALNNASFLQAAPDGFLQATIARGRHGTAMRAWGFGGQGFTELAPAEINDIVAYIRGWEE